jgi:putative hydroxymethylpyrimidine transport system substrate-binding protein
MRKLLPVLTLCLLSCTAFSENKPLTIILDWFVNPQHAPIVIAQEKGFFKQHGLTVNIIQPSDPADPVKLVAAGQADLGIDYQPELYLQVANGLPLVRIGTLIDSPLRVVAVLENSKIKTIADLKNKKIGVSISGVGDAILDTMLRYNHVDPKNVELINVNYDIVQALLSQRVAAISGAQRNFEVPELTLAQHPARVFYPEQNGVPMYDELIFVANKNNLHDPRLLAFMEAISEATQYIKKHPKDSWQLLLKAYPALAKPASMKALNQASWQITQPLFASESIALNAARYVSFAKWMQQEKLISTILPIANYAADLRKI